MGKATYEARRINCIVKAFTMEEKQTVINMAKERKSIADILDFLQKRGYEIELSDIDKIVFKLVEEIRKSSLVKKANQNSGMERKDTQLGGFERKRKNTQSGGFESFKDSLKKYVNGSKSPIVYSGGSNLKKGHERE